MEPTTKIQDSIRFGDDFELDRATCQLRRSGRVLKMERIPVEVLLFLIQQRGELVTREQIVEKIWGKDVFLDTDNSINGAIRKVRQSLKDDPEQPRFIQTITGKGYRFIAPVVDLRSESLRSESPPPVVALPSSAYQRSIEWVTQGRWVLLGTLILVLVLIVTGVYFRRPKSEAQPLSYGGRTMLAVLPFDNLTGDASREYFSEGMTEEMISQLGSLDPNRMGVIARTSVMHYKNSQKQLPQIARELGVQYVLEGSVRGDAGKVRITAQLIQMKDQTHLWARQYDREPKDLLVLQSEIAHQISDEIQKALGDRKLIPPTPEPTLSPETYEAYNLYLKGQYFWNKRTVKGFEEAIKYFQQATVKDPHYARAYAGLADSYALIGTYIGAPPDAFADKAHAAALRALQLDDSLPEAHAALALIVQNYEYDWRTAEKEFKRAIELNPNYATAHHWYAEHLMWRGRFDEALRESARARQLDPLSLIIQADNGAILYFSRQYDRAISEFNAVRELDPDFPRARMICSAYVEKGMFAEALAAHKHILSSNTWDWAELAYIYGRGGRMPEAQHAMKELLRLNRLQPLDPIVMVQPYLGLGNNDLAIASLERAYAQHSNGLTALKVEPAFDSLRGDHRFQDLLQKVGLAD